MSIRKKLLISNFGMVFIPAVLFFLSAMLLYGLLYRELTTVTDYYGGTEAKTEGIAAIRDQFERRNDLFAGIRFFARYEPERLDDGAFLREMDTRLEEAKAGIVIVKDGAVAYASPGIGEADWTELRDAAERDFHHESFHGLNTEDRHYSVERIGTVFPDGESGEVYMLADMSPFMRLFPWLMPLVALVLLVILGLTNGVLTYFVSRSFIRPLYALKEAAERIKEGDLEQELKLQRKDEFGEVSGAFEEMRLRLKQSIGLQLQYEENRKELLSNISHDLKTPITAIKGCVEGILDGVADTPEKRGNYLRMISRKAADMDRQIDELFLFSKLDLKRVPFHFERLKLSAYLRDCAEELSLQPQSAGIAIRYESEAEGEVTARADREKLQRVIQNIVDNSIKYMEREPKRIDIVLSASEDEATVRIRDTGTGIEPEALPHIFDRFYRADESRGGGTGGTGLGLAIVKQIVEEHGGRVWAESKPGEGTTVAWTLPRWTDEGGEERA